LSEKQVEELSVDVKIIRFEAGDQIIQLGDLAQSMYLISEGHLEVGILGADGSNLIVANLWPGDCVGEMSLLTGEPRSANVYAKSKGILLELSKDSLAPIFKSSPILIEEISQMLSDRKMKNQKSLMGEADQVLVDSQVKILAQRIFKFFFG
jgi:CRP-like cAMP-binding protein